MNGVKPPQIVGVALLLYSADTRYMWDQCQAVLDTGTRFGGQAWLPCLKHRDHDGPHVYNVSWRNEGNHDGDKWT
jgi:hypothetical protein